ncbi:MAG: TIM barrel protein [Clostridiaceae bacterium]|nr:TIM barrel protein [Clostridiaceae bacterium]
MAKISLCIEPVLTEYALEDRIRIAGETGFKAVEFWDPAGRDLSRLASAAAASGVRIAGCTLNQAWTCRMDQSADQVVANVRRSIEMAGELGCPTMIGLAGDLTGRTDTQKNILIENLKRVADLFVQADLTLVLEALNSYVDHKGYYLDSSLVAFEIAKCVNCPNIRMLFDVYHMQIMEGNIISHIRENIDWIGHFHTAGVPGRHEPMDGENNYPYILSQIDALGYDRYVGLEYWPTYDHRQSIADCLAHMTV